MIKVKKVCVITGSRAEYGLMSNLLNCFHLSDKFELQLIVTGTHLSKDHGFTYKEIIKDDLNISGKIDLNIKKSDPNGLSNQMSRAFIGFSKFFSKLKPDLIIILGDRYEIFCAATVATLYTIPIAHIHGGEVTQGSIDNAFRHAITKMSHIHFVATKKSKLRVMQLGESENNIFHVGSMGVENVTRLKLLSKNQLEKELNINFNRKTLLITFHPETLSELTPEEQINPLLKSLNKIQDTNFLFTMSNSDVGGDKINNKIIQFIERNKNAYFFKNLGYLKYLSAVKFCSAVVGNSSSGIIEAPSLNIPSVNIGSRQLGREKHLTVYDCPNNKEKILDVCMSVLTNPKKLTNQMKPPYEKSQPSYNIMKIVEKIDLDELKIKRFKDIQFNDK
jgi:GDP/UDP-N,N'-diacetylbacillosamine 2-epimerase (hydrolysing)